MMDEFVQKSEMFKKRTSSNDRVLRCTGCRFPRVVNSFVGFWQARRPIHLVAVKPTQLSTVEKQNKKLRKWKRGAPRGRVKNWLLCSHECSHLPHRIGKHWSLLLIKMSIPEWEGSLGWSEFCPGWRLVPVRRSRDVASKVSNSGRGISYNHLTDHICHVSAFQPVFRSPVPESSVRSIKLTMWQYQGRKQPWLREIFRPFPGDFHFRIFILQV